MNVRVRNYASFEYFEIELKMKVNPFQPIPERFLDKLKVKKGTKFYKSVRGEACEVRRVICKKEGVYFVYPERLVHPEDLKNLWSKK